MKLFIDTANVEQIKLANDLGVISGVTTNPSLIAREGKPFAEVIREITPLVNGPISADVMSADSAGMLTESLELAKMHKNIVIKMPMSLESLKTTRYLSLKGLKTNITLIFSAAQALLAARAGATFISPFLGRLDDMGQNGLALIEEIADIFKIHDIKTEIIAASIRTPVHVIEAARHGAHIATVPYDILMQMAKHPLTDAGFEQFLEDWEKLPK